MKQGTAASELGDPSNDHMSTPSALTPLAEPRVIPRPERSKTTQAIELKENTDPEEATAQNEEDHASSSEAHSVLSN